MTISFLGWGALIIDFDNDGWKDIFAQRPLPFQNRERGAKFELAPAVEGSRLASLLQSRGAVVGDLFNSGRQDIVANQMDKPPALFKNVHANQNHWFQFKLIGGPKSARDAIGAKVYVTAAGSAGAAT